MGTRFFSFSILIEQKEDKGEDATPILTVLDDYSGWLGVFDGMGGAGGAMYEVDGKKLTGAYIAANSARAAVQSFFHNLKLSAGYESPANEVAASLTKYLSVSFKQLASQFVSDTSPRLKSSLIKTFPTTMAALSYQLVRKRSNQEFAFECKSFWAGDSRCYVLSPNVGLQQLSIDDLKSGGDALHNLTNDSPISNCINADADFSVRYQEALFQSPIIFITATDGCFGFLSSPAHFEFLLLSSLHESSDEKGWKDRLHDEFKAVAGDDVSLALVAGGWNRFADIKSCFSNRLRFLREKYIDPINEKNEEIADLERLIEQDQRRRDKLIREREKLRDSLWTTYKLGYESGTTQEAMSEKG